MNRSLNSRAVTLSLTVALMSVLSTSCSREEPSGAGRGVTLTGSAEVARGTGADLDELGPTLSLSAREGRLVLSYTRREGQVAPRTAELFVSYPEALNLSEFSAGEALRLASKELIIQSPSPGLLRVVIMSTGNLNTIDSGPLAYLSFDGPSPALSEVYLQARRTYFAPAEANTGVTLSPVAPEHDEPAGSTMARE